MYRWIIILVLASTQFLFSGHGGVYVCMGSDGAFCFETDPEACTCCKAGGHEEADRGSDICPCSCTKTGASSPLCDTVVTNQSECGCVHLIIAGDQVLPSVRASYEVSLGWNRSAIAASLFSFDCSDHSTSQQSISDVGFAFCKPALDAHSLVMRC